MKPSEKPKPDITVDALGQLCPIPIIMLSKAADEMEPGQVLEILADDHGIVNDLALWCKSSGNQLIAIEEMEEIDGQYRGLVKKLK